MTTGMGTRLSIIPTSFDVDIPSSPSLSAAAYPACRGSDLDTTNTLATMYRPRIPHIALCSPSSSLVYRVTAAVLLYSLLCSPSVPSLMESRLLPYWLCVLRLLQVPTQLTAACGGSSRSIVCYWRTHEENGRPNTSSCRSYHCHTYLGRRPPVCRVLVRSSWKRKSSLSGCNHRRRRCHAAAMPIILTPSRRSLSALQLPPACSLPSPKNPKAQRKDFQAHHCSSSLFVPSGIIAAVHDSNVSLSIIGTALPLPAVGCSNL